MEDGFYSLMVHKIALFVQDELMASIASGEDGYLAASALKGFLTP